MNKQDQHILDGLKFLSEEGMIELRKILGVETVKKRVSKKSRFKNISTGNKY